MKKSASGKDKKMDYYQSGFKWSIEKSLSISPHNLDLVVVYIIFV